MMRFSAKYGSFSSWLSARPRTSAYALRVIAAHSNRPVAPLSALRGGGISRKAWTVLSPTQKYERNLSFEALRRIKAGEPLKNIVKDLEIPKQKILDNLGRSIFRKKGRYVARGADYIQRSMHIYSEGRVRTIVVKNSKDASIIGEYHNAVRKYLPSGDRSGLRKFHNVTITDANGKKHKLETDPDTLRKLDAMHERSEEFEIYSED